MHCTAKIWKSIPGKTENVLIRKIFLAKILYFPHLQDHTFKIISEFYLNLIFLRNLILRKKFKNSVYFRKLLGKIKKIFSKFFWENQLLWKSVVLATKIIILLLLILVIFFFFCWKFLDFLEFTFKKYFHFWILFENNPGTNERSQKFSYRFFQSNH